MKSNQEILINIGRGKTIIIRLLYIGDADDSGNRIVYFRLNGQTRSVEVNDKKAGVFKISNLKVSQSNHIGTPIQGLLSKIFVAPGQKVTKNTPLFTIEAMKMKRLLPLRRIWLLIRLF